VLDHWGAHRARRIEETVHACDARGMWLPPSPPDLSPLASMGGELETYLRTVRARPTADLDHAVAAGLRLIPPSDCRSWFTHGGYQVAEFCKPL